MYVAERDRDRVLSLINHDRLIGQPVCAAAMLESAVHGRAVVDQELWQELEGVQTWVVEAADQIAAAFSIGRMATDSTIELLWLHAREDQELIEVCLRKVMKVAPKAVRAFSFSTPLTAGVEALPVKARPTTARILSKFGFQRDDLWSYMVKPELGLAKGMEQNYPIKVEGSAGRWIASLDDQGGKAGYVEFGLIGITGVIWYLSVVESRRRQGIARSLMDKALLVLAEHRADCAVLYVDDDEDYGPRNRAAAKGLYRSLGFSEIDRLCSYHHST